MQTIINLLFSFTIAIVFSFCAGDEKQEKISEENTSHDHTAMEQSAHASNSIPVIKNANLQAVYQQYIQLTTALTNGNEAEARIAANAIEAGAKYVSGASDIATAAAKITTAKNIEAQRTAYATLSNNMIALVKKEGLTKGELYMQHCPMAFNDKGASWLATTKEVRNPYFGDKMLNCGEVRDTIN